jgi:hypothetical protein
MLTVGGSGSGGPARTLGADPPDEWRVRQALARLGRRPSDQSPAPLLSTVMSAILALLYSVSNEPGCARGLAVKYLPPGLAREEAQKVPCRVGHFEVPEAPTSVTHILERNDTS